MHVKWNHCSWPEVPTVSEAVSLELVWLFLYYPVVIMKLEAAWKEWGTWVCSDGNHVSNTDFSSSGFKCWMTAFENNEKEYDKNPEVRYSWAWNLIFADNQVLARLLWKPRMNIFVITGDSQQELCKTSVFKWKGDDHIRACWDGVLSYIPVGGLASVWFEWTLRTNYHLCSDWLPIWSSNHT